MKKIQKRIGLYGGSFNPIHKGHINIANYAIKKLKLDELIFIPAYKSPDKITSFNYESPKNRVAMIQKVLPKKCSINTWELDREGTSYTYETIAYFAQLYKNDALFFIIGSDNLEHIDQWEGINNFSNYCQLVCFKRSNKISLKNTKNFNIKMLNNPLYHFSSTNYRSGNLFNIDKNVQAYIGDKVLYLNLILQNVYTKKQWEVISEQTKWAIRIAAEINFDAKATEIFCKTYLIGMQLKNDNPIFAKIKLPKNLANKAKQELLIYTKSYLWLAKTYKLTNEIVLNDLLAASKQKFSLLLLICTLASEFLNKDFSNKKVQKQITEIGKQLKKALS